MDCSTTWARHADPSLSQLVETLAGSRTADRSADSSRSTRAVCSRMARAMVPQSAWSMPWPLASSVSSPRARDLCGQGLPVLDWEHRVCGAVDHQGGDGDRGQRRLRRLVLGERCVVLGRLRCRGPARRLAGSAHGQRPRRTAAPRPRASADSRPDSRRPSRDRTSRLGGGQEVSIGRRSAVAAGARRASPGEVLMRTSERMRSGKASADSCANAPPARRRQRAQRDPVGVEHSGFVGDQVYARVVGLSLPIGHRAARVPVVVADHEPPSVGEHPAEPVLPPEHRGADPHHQENRRVIRVADASVQSSTPFASIMRSARFAPPEGQIVGDSHGFRVSMDCASDPGLERCWGGDGMRPSVHLGEPLPPARVA